MTDIPQTDDVHVLAGSIPTELWAVEITYLPAFPVQDRVDEFLDRQREKGIPEEDLEFFWPTLSRVYRSRSGARDRLSLFETYGARGHLVRATPSWEPVESKDAKIARLEARVAELEQERPAAPSRILQQVDGRGWGVQAAAIARLATGMDDLR